jgi:hypothetical protein
VLVVGVVALALYLLTLAPEVVAIDDDTLEFQMVALRGAIPHPTGYPLYAVLLALSARVVPFGEVAFRANLLSALLGAGAVALTFGVGRALGLRRFAALQGAAIFALSPTFWSQATVAEVYTLHALLSGGLVLCVLRWGREQAKRPSPALPVGAALFFGLGLAHHRTIVLWLPAIALYAMILFRQRGSTHTIPHSAFRIPRSAFRIPRFVLTLIAPLLLYLWLPLRAGVGSIDGTYEEVGFTCWVTACQYGSFFEDNALASARAPGFYATLTLVEVGWVALGLAAVGLVALWRRERPAWALLVAGLVVNGGFGMAYRVPDPEVFWLPVVWVLALLAGAGVEWLWSESRAVARAGRWVRLLVSLALAVVLAPLVVRWASTYSLVDRSRVGGPEAFNGRDVLSQPLPNGAVIIGLLGEVTYLRYLQEGQGLNPGVATVDVPADPLSERYAAVEEALAAGHHPFLTRELPGAGEPWSLSALGPLVEVLPAPRTEVPPGLWPLEVPMGEAVTLVGWTRSPIEGSNEERVTVAWRVEQPLTESLQVSARLIGENGTVHFQKDEVPLDNAYPTTMWRPGEVILDTYSFPPAPPGARYLLVLYRAADGSEVGRAEMDGGR